jgi:hypothetical protein
VSLLGRVFRSLFRGNKGTPQPVSKPTEVQRETLPQFEPVEETVTYPSGWNANDRKLWDAQVNPAMHRYYSQDEWEAAQEALEQGWMFPSRSKESVQPYRDEFFRISTVTEDQFDWRAFREWYANN